MNAASLKAVRLWLLRPTFLTLAVTLLLSVLLCGSAVAAGEEAHPPLGSFGRSAIENFVNPNGIAVEEATGDVYVAEVGVDEQQMVSIEGGPTGGSFTLEFEGERTTAPLTISETSSPSAGEVEGALTALPKIGKGNVSVAETGALPGTVTYTITFSGALSGKSLPSLTCSGANLIGGASPTCTVATTTPGVEGDVYKFDAEGKPVNFSVGGHKLTGAATPAGSFSFLAAAKDTPAAIAVDNSTKPSDPSRGDLYVMDAGHNAIDKFSPSGTYLSQITGPFEGELRGLAVDANGDVRVAATHEYIFGSGPAELWIVDLFDNSVVNNFVTPVRVETSIDTTSLHPPEYGFTVGPTGDYYMLFECGCVEKLGTTLAGLGLVDSAEGRPADVAMAVDQATGHLYVDEQSSVEEFDTGGMDGYFVPPAAGEDVPSAMGVSSFGSLSGVPGQQGGIAVDGASGQIYVSDPADGKVDVFASSPPGVVAAAAENITQVGATLQGKVDPRGHPVTSCEFEYEKTPEAIGSIEDGHEFSVPVAVFHHHVPCAQTAAQIETGAGPVAVSADIPNSRESPLEAGTLYYFRLVAGNAKGTSSSQGMFATSGPGFGIKGLSVAFLEKDGTVDTQAGSHPYEMVTNFAFNTEAERKIAGTDSSYVLRPVGNARDIIFTPPPGFVGNPNATESKCTASELLVPNKGNPQFGATECPTGSQVGELYVETIGYGTAVYPLYNMVPPHGVGAQFGAHITFLKSFIDAGLQTGGQYPVQAESLDLPAIEPIFRIKATLFGEVDTGEHGEPGVTGGNRKPFLMLPTSCTAPLSSTIKVDSYQQPGHYVEKSEFTRTATGEPLRLTGCSKLKFPPAITVAPDTQNASSSSGLTVDVHVPQTAAFTNPEGLAESTLRDTTVTLPAGVMINPAGGGGLQGCSEGLAGFEKFVEFNPELEPGVKTFTFSPTPIEMLEKEGNFCPKESKIGTVTIKTPLLSHPLEGALYVATQNENPFGSLLAMYMMIEDPISESTVKLLGEVRLCEAAGEILNGVSCQAPGQIVTTFENNPNMPFEDLELHLFGGERAPLSTPARCGTYTTVASFTPWDGNPPVEASSSFAIEHGPHGGPCPGASLPFSPSLAAGTTSNNAGQFSSLSTTIGREDGQQDMQSVQIHMPPGLSGLLTGVKLCPEAQANAGACGPESEIGETTVAAGVGSEPVAVKGGRVYLTEKYAGAPFGLSIVNPVKAGPFDLEHDTSNPNQQPACDCVVVRAKIEVDPHTAALTVTTDPSGPHAIPHFIDGIPVQIQKVNVTITRRGFTFNPTDCRALTATGSINGDEGGSSPVSVSFQATNCAILKFGPKFEVSTSGKTSKGRGASLVTKLSEPAGALGTQVNIAKVKVELPKQLPSRLTTLQKACSAAQFDANPAACPAKSVVGHAVVHTPVLPVPLEGPAYFVSNGSEAFPNLIIVLQGYGVTVDLVGQTFINEKTNITSSTFPATPDVPFQTFELTLPQGLFSALTFNTNLCKAASKLKMPTEFIAQDGAQIKTTTKVKVTSCPRVHKVKRRHKHKRHGRR